MKNNGNITNLLKILIMAFFFQYASAAENQANNQVVQISGGGTFNLNHNIIQGGKSFISGTVNISNNDATDANDTDPLFINTADGNLNLQPGSPAVDTGNNTLFPVSISIDITGNQRINNTYIDLGAYESSPSLGENTLTLTNDVRIYPNPASNYLLVDSRVPAHQIRLFDIVGKQIHAFPEVSGEGLISFDVSKLERGMYLLLIDKTTYKIILQ